MPSPATPAIIADSQSAEQLAVAQLTPGQALELVPHARRRLKRRERALHAAMARYSAAYMDAVHLDRLAGAARVYYPTTGSAA